MGRSNAISTSKIRKITAIRKNRREKGRRAEPFGSKPHSKGEFFSRSLIDFFERRDAISITKQANIMIINDMVRDNQIIYFECFNLFNWKLSVLIY